jgi:hypothetical protein
MNVTLNSIWGFDDAIATMYLSKRTWTPELDARIRQTICARTWRYDGGFLNIEDDPELKKWMDTLFKIGSRHMTLLRFINFSVSVQDIHRGAQDDFDSHAKRLDNRIIRSSTRLAKFGENEMSDYYQGQIIPTDAALTKLNIALPGRIEVDGKPYVKAVNGYVREDLANNKDVLRGLYMLSIPSTFIFQCNITEWAHIYKERNTNSGANPELKAMVETVCELLQHSCPYLTRELFMKIPN